MSTDLQTLAGSVSTVSGIREFLNRLHGAWNDDPEAAHGLEDAIKSRVIELVAEGHPYARVIAAEVRIIDTWDDVERWYA